MVRLNVRMFEKSKNLIFVVLTLLFLSCIDDYEKIEVKKKTENIKIKVEYGGVFFENNPLIRGKLTKFKNELSQKRMISSTFNFEIDETLVQTIETDSAIIYTFKILRDNENQNLLENYVMYQKGNSIVRHFIALYPFSNINGEKSYLENKSLVEISNPNLNNTNRGSTNSDCTWLPVSSYQSEMTPGRVCGCDGQHFYGDLECNCPASPPTPTTVVTYEVITWTQDCSNTGAGGGGGSGGGSGDEILTVPFDDTNNNILSDPCNQLLNNTGQNNSSENIRSNLLQLLENTDLSYETAFSQISNNGSYSIINSNNNTSSETSVQIRVGKVSNDSYVINIAHTHTSDLYPIYSFSDLYTLFKLFQLGNEETKAKGIFYLLQKECVTCLPKIYALKVNDIVSFQNSLNSFMNNPDTYGMDEKMKIKYANDLFHNKLKFYNSSASSNLESILLQSFNGLKMFKSSPNLNNWSEITISNNTILEKPC